MKDSTLCSFCKGRGLFIQKSIDNVRDREKLSDWGMVVGNFGGDRLNFLGRGCGLKCWWRLGFRLFAVPPLRCGAAAIRQLSKTKKCKMKSLFHDYLKKHIKKRRSKL